MKLVTVEPRVVVHESPYLRLWRDREVTRRCTEATATWERAVEKLCEKTRRLTREIRNLDAEYVYTFRESRLGEGDV